jgi:SAM-dependent methyltransferase
MLRAEPFFAFPSYKQELLRRIEAEIEEQVVEAVLEVGGIDRPLLKCGADFDYDGLDIEHREGCDEVYDRFFVQSIERPLPRSYDVIVSITLLEHVRDNSAAFDSIFRSLAFGGSTHHYVPSKYHPYALCLRTVGPKLQKRLISILRPGLVGETGYPAFFDHCSPRAMRRLLEDIGFVDIDVRAYYRANDYFAFFLPAYVLVTTFENLCRRWGWTTFASGFVVSARRPDDLRDDT